MEVPTKEEFQELIDVCNQNPYEKFIVDEKNIVKSSIGIVEKIIKTREELYKKLKLLIAYQWMLTSCEAKIHTLCPDLVDNKKRSMKFYRERINNMHCRLSRGGSDSKKIINKLQNYLNNIARNLQDREQIIAHISKSLTHYYYPEYYPEYNLTLTDYNNEINQAIKDLKKAHESIIKLKKYNSLFFVSSFTGGEVLLDELEHLEAIQRNAMFHSKKVKKIKEGGKHEIRVLIISVTKWFLLNGGISKKEDEGDYFYYFKDVLNLNESLMGLVKQSMSHKSIRGILNDEINRIRSDAHAYGLYQRPNAKKRREAILKLTNAHKLKER